MASYFEVKQLLKDIFCIDMDIDETCDIILPISSRLGEDTNLANRIYETRNALVHSKSEQIANQYRPYDNKKDLASEIALIKAVAESVLINSSEIL